jgi:hypothetical protein
MIPCRGCCRCDSRASVSIICRAWLSLLRIIKGRRRIRESIRWLSGAGWDCKDVPWHSSPPQKRKSFKFFIRVGNIFSYGRQMVDTLMYYIIPIIFKSQQQKHATLSILLQKIRKGLKYNSCKRFGEVKVYLRLSIRDRKSWV